MRIIPLLLALALPLTALAQPYSNAPVVIVGEGAPAPKPTVTAAASAGGSVREFPNFPDAAVTRVGQASNSDYVPPPQNPANPPAPAGPSAAPIPANPQAPASPLSPASPISKLWPRNTIEIFMPPCTGLRPQFVVPCTCTITKLMATMPHDEFLAESDSNTIESDPRLIKIRTDCATAPQQKSQ